jgi:hypothetical protein
MRLNDTVYKKADPFKKLGIVSALEFYFPKEHVRSQQVFIIWDDKAESCRKACFINWWGNS